jgi:SH3-like domain-containing protein
VKPFIPHKIKVLYEFVGNAAEGELSVATGETVHIIQPEVEGWVKVRSAKNQEGFVPASYLDGM